MSDITELEIPPGLCPVGDRAARAIVRVAAVLAARSCREPTTGGHRAFFTPEEWLASGEEYGRNAVLIVVHDGGDLAPCFNFAYEDEAAMRLALVILQRVGCWAEQCTGWYTAIYQQR